MNDFVLTVMVALNSPSRQRVLWGVSCGNPWDRWTDIPLYAGRSDQGSLRAITGVVVTLERFHPQLNRSDEAIFAKILSGSRHS